MLVMLLTLLPTTVGATPVVVTTTVAPTAAPASATIVSSTDGDWRVDNVPLIDACQTLSSVDEVFIQVDRDATWRTIEPALLQARKCGVSRLGIRVNDHEPLWIEFDGNRGPVLFVSPHATHVVHGGARAEVDLNGQSDPALLERLFATVGWPCLAVLPAARVGNFVDAHLFVGKSRTGKKRTDVRVLLGAEIQRLTTSDGVVVGVLRGDNPQEIAQSDGLLTRWFGESSMPQSTTRKVPRWTQATSLLCKADSGSQMWGIGTITGIRNSALARSAADNRARAAIASLVSVQLERTKDSLVTSSAVTLTNVSIADRHTDGETTWALAIRPVEEPASEACPEGDHVLHEWRWVNVGPEGNVETPEPGWAKMGFNADEAHLWMTVSRRSSNHRPLEESEALVGMLVRSRLTEVLGSSVLDSETLERSLRTDTSEDCLAAVPWADVASSAPVETWYDTTTAALFARASIDRKELLGALGPGCASDLVDDLIRVCRKSATSFPGVGDARCERSHGREEAIDYPQWVLRGSGPATTAQGRVFFGVGSVSGIDNIALARTTADNRARAEIAKVFEVYSASMMRDYATARSKKDRGGVHVEGVIHTFSAMTLSGVQVVDHWFHPDGTVYALAQLDLEVFDMNLGKMKLNEQILEYVRKNARRLHEELIDK